MGRPPPSGLSFEFSEDDDRLMESALRNSELPDGDPDDLPEDLLASPKKSKRKSSSKHPDDTIDLHGKTQEEAIRMVQNFVRTSHVHSLRNVLIITGKGLHSGTQGPILNAPWSSGSSATARPTSRNSTTPLPGTAAPVRSGCGSSSRGATDQKEEATDFNDPHGLKNFQSYP